MKESERLIGLVLSGGFSTRMGRDKGALPWEGSMLVHVQASRLDEVVNPVFISCRQEQQASLAGPYEIITDAYPSGGPMSGMLTAMEAHPNAAWLVLGVDMVGIDEATLRHLQAQRDPSCIATAFRQQDGIIQPLVAIWEQKALPLLKEAWARQRYSLRKLLEEHNAHILEPLPSTDLQNLNTLDQFGGNWLQK